MATLDDELLALVGDYLRGALTLHHVENWVTTRESTEFGGWEVELFQTLELDLAELGSGGLTEGELQASIRECLKSRLMPKMITVRVEAFSASSNNALVRIGPVSSLSVPLSVGRTEPQRVYG